MSKQDKKPTHKDFLREVLDYQRDLNKQLSIRREKLQNMVDSGKFNSDFLREKQNEVAAYEAALLGSVRDEADRMRAKYCDFLADSYSPTRAKLSDNIREALTSGISFSPKEFEMIARDCQTDYDMRAVTDAAAKNGITLKGFISADTRLARFDNFVKRLTTPISAEEARYAPESSEQIRREQLWSLYERFEDAEPIVAYPEPHDFKSAGEAAQAEYLAAQKAEAEKTATAEQEDADDTAEQNAAPTNEDTERGAFLTGAGLTDDSATLTKYRDEIVRDAHEFRAREEARKAVEEHMAKKRATVNFIDYLDTKAAKEAEPANTESDS